MTKNKIIIYATILVIALIWVIVISQQDKDSANKPRAVTVTDLEGNVKVVTSNGSKTISAFKKMRLVQGDKLSTGGKAWVTLKIDSDKEVMVSENTSVSIDQLSGSDDGTITRLALETGKVWTNIKEKLNRNSTYEIKTPTATMGVRGTKFYVDSADDYTKLAVLDGTVASSTTITTRDPEGRIKVEEVTLLIEKNKQISLAKDGVTSKEELIKNIKEVSVSTFDSYTLRFFLDNPDELDKKFLDEIKEHLKVKEMEETLVKEGKVQLKGTVSLPNGKRNTEGGHIHIRDSANNWKYYGLLNEKGEFVAGNLSDGSYWLRSDPEITNVHARSNEIPFNIINGTADRDISINLNSIQFSGTIVNPNGSPVNEGNLYIRDSQGHWVYYAEIEKGVNIINVGGLADGSYDLIAYPASDSEFVQSSARSLNIMNGVADSYNISIRLNNPQFSGQVMLANGTPANAKGHLHVRNDQGKWLQYVKLDTNGGFKIGGLMDGKYWLRADWPGTNGEENSSEQEVMIVGGKAAPAAPQLLIGQ